MFCAGCLFGLLAFSRLLRWLLDRFPQIMLAVLCGFMLGSLRKLWPFKHDLTPDIAEFKLKQFENVWPVAFDGDTLLTVLLAAGALGLLLSFELVSRRGSLERSRLDGTDPGQEPV